MGNAIEFVIKLRIFEASLNEFSKYILFGNSCHSSESPLYFNPWTQTYLSAYLVSPSDIIKARSQFSEAHWSFYLNGQYPLQISISMRESQSQISQFLWEISADFCPRIIVIDGLILSVSSIGSSHFIVDRLWLPSGIKLICSRNVYKNESIKSIVIENVSKLEKINSEAFQKTALNFFTIPSSVEVLGEKCFSHCGSLSSVRF
jgi:hypothetical protein